MTYGDSLHRRALPTKPRAPSGNTRRAWLSRAAILSTSVVAIVWTAAALAHEPSAQTSTAGSIRIRVHVRGANGEPQRDLARDAFTVRVAEVPVEIISFAQVDLSRSRRRPSDGTAEDLSDVFQSSTSPAGGRLIAVALDSALSTEPSQVQRMQRLLDGVAGRLTADDSLAIVSSLRAMSPSISGFRNLSSEHTKMVGRAVTRLRAGPLGSDDRLDGRAMAHRNLQSLLQAMGAQPAPRVLLLVSSGLATVTRDGRGQLLYDATSEEALDETVRVARSQQVTISAVDPILRDFSYTQDESLRMQHEYLAKIAELTGGRFVVPQADLRSAAADLLDPTAHFYELELRTSTAVRDVSAYQVTVTSEAPVIVTVIEPSPSSARDRHLTDLTTEVSSAAVFGTLDSNLVVRAFATPIEFAEADRVSTNVWLDAGADGTPAEDLLIRVAAFGDDDRLRAVFAPALQAVGSGEAATAAFRIELPRDTVRFTVAVASRTTGALGTVQVPVVLPRASDPIVLSGVFLRERTESEGLAWPGIPAWSPVLDRRFARGHRSLEAYAVATWAGADARSISVRHSVSADGSEVFAEAGFVTAEASPESGTQRARIVFPLRLESLTPGVYRIKLEVWGPQGGYATRALSFFVDGQDP